MLPESVLDEILICESVLGLRTDSGVPADVSDVDGTISVDQGLIQLELEIGQQYADRAELVEPVRVGWAKYKKRSGNFGPVIRKAVEIIPELFRGLKRADVQVLAERVAEREAVMTYAFPRKLYKLLRERKEGRRLLLAITGSPHDYAVPFCKALGFDAAVGCWMEVDRQGRYTGERDERPAMDKGPVMDELSRRRGLVWNGGLAFGDSPTDIPLFERCSCRLAINPTMELQTWMREHTELRVVWVNDHQKTGIQLYEPDEYGRYCECDTLAVLPSDLALVMHGTPGAWKREAILTELRG